MRLCRGRDNRVFSFGIRIPLPVLIIGFDERLEPDQGSSSARSICAQIDGKIPFSKRSSRNATAGISFASRRNCSRTGPIHTIDTTVRRWSWSFPHDSRLNPRSAQPREQGSQPRRTQMSGPTAAARTRRRMPIATGLGGGASPPIRISRTRAGAAGIDPSGDDHVMGLVCVAPVHAWVRVPGNRQPLDREWLRLTASAASFSPIRLIFRSRSRFSLSQ